MIFSLVQSLLTALMFLPQWHLTCGNRNIMGYFDLDPETNKYIVRDDPQPQFGTG